MSELEPKIGITATDTRLKNLTPMDEEKYPYPLQERGRLLTRKEFLQYLAVDAFFGSIILGGGISFILYEISQGSKQKPPNPTAPTKPSPLPHNGALAPKS